MKRIATFVLLALTTVGATAMENRSTTTSMLSSLFQKQIISFRAPAANANQNEDFKVGAFYYLYNVGSDKYYTAGNTWGTQCSVGDEPLLVQFVYYNNEDKNTLLLRNYVESKDGWNTAFFDSDDAMFVDRLSQANYGWTIQKVGDYYRMQASESTEINPTYSSTAYPNQYVGLDVTSDAANTALSPFLSEGDGHYIDWALVPVDGFQSIVSASPVALSFTNDTDNPWTIEGNTAIIRGNNQPSENSGSWLTMTYTIDQRTKLSFEWASYNYSYHPLKLYIDGVSMGNTTSSSFTSKQLFLDAGTHVIAFCDEFQDYNYSNNWSAIRNLKVSEILPLETIVLTSNSTPLSFTNDEQWPWTIEDGYIQNSNNDVASSTSSFSTTFEINEPSKFSFERQVTPYITYSGWDPDFYSISYQYLYTKINGKTYMADCDQSDWGKCSVMLEPGKYTIEWIDTIGDYNYESFYSRVRNIELSSNWVDVELASAGSLGVEILYEVNVLKDVELLKVKGPINSADWATIKQMTNLLAIDLSEATFDALPDYAFDGLISLSNVKLPEGVRTIGEYAFRDTQIWEITIPSTITTIGQYAFANTRLQNITFAEGSRLQNISQYAFQNCTSLQEVIMPNTVTTIGECAFGGCSALQTLWFSDEMVTIDDNVCFNCTQLSDVHLPAKLITIGHSAFYNTYMLSQISYPNSLNKIGSNAFYNSGIESVKLPVTLEYLGEDAFRSCKKLKYIELPSFLDNNYRDPNGNSFGYINNFYGCDAIETIVMNSATPPAIVYDPFQNARDKSSITLKVPSFAVVNYKLDSYWYQFGSIVEGDDIDYWKITSTLYLTNNRRMQGKPDIDLYLGGQLIVGGAAPMETGQFNLHISEDNPGRLLNTCDAITADNINTYFAVNSEKWYFITPLHDVNLTEVTVSNDASYVFRYYDGSSRAANGTGNSWRNVDNGKLTAGQGYIFRCNKNAVITFPAETAVHAQVFNTADVTKQLAAYEATASANKSWNFIGNPYPCYYDIYYMDFTAPITVWTGTTYKAYSIVDDNYALRPMQAFFVQKPDAVDNIIFHKEGRQLTSEINHAVEAHARRAPVTSNRHFFDLQILGEDATDETRVVVNEDASLNYEIQCDASKFMSFESGVPQLFTLDCDDNGCAINERPLSDGNVKLAYYTSQPGYFTICATRADGDIYLLDSKMNKTVNLNEQDYMFHSNATDGINTSRFMLILNVKNNGVSTIIEKIDEEQTFDDIYDLQGRKIQIPAKKGIYIINGQKVVYQ